MEDSGERGDNQWRKVPKEAGGDKIQSTVVEVSFKQEEEPSLPLWKNGGDDGNQWGKESRMSVDVGIIVSNVRKLREFS